MSRPEVVVIGAGVAGLCAGIYLQASGYDAHIYERHTRPGGLCASWRRGGYTFDGCVHWMLGSGAGSAFHPLWREVMDLDAMSFLDHEEVVQLELPSAKDPSGSPIFHLWSDIDRLERELLSSAPEDAAWIRAFTAAARRVQRYDLPPLAHTAPELQTLGQKMGLATMLPFVWIAWRWGRITNLSAAKSVRSPWLREVLEQVFDGQEQSLLVLLMQLAWYDQRAAGYPAGGSASIVGALVARFEALGGRLHLGEGVARVLVEEGRAVGVALDRDAEHRASAVISAADGHWTLYEALGGRYLHKEHRACYEQGERTTFPSLVYVSLGLRRDLASLPTLLRFPLPEPFTLPCGTEVARLALHNFACDPTMAPPGCTMVNLMIDCREDTFWAALRERDRAAYEVAKEQIARLVIDALEARFGDFAAHVEVVDVATPATFLRYTNNWRGSYEGWLPQKLISGNLPAEVPGLTRFRMIGQWTTPGGGLPMAIWTARNTVQVLCHRDGMAFLADQPAAVRAPCGRREVAETPR
ncbi:MAG: NAD(P)/FAD-dependent oxidoreductase [Pseudomonadota bacterium]